MMIKFLKTNYTWVFSGLGVVILAGAWNWLTPSSNATAGHNISAGGDVNVNDAGRDVIINQPQQRVLSKLEIVDARRTDEFGATYDILVRNPSETDILVYELCAKSVEYVESSNITPGLEPSARYILPVSRTEKSGSYCIDVSFVVRANSADRFLVSFLTLHRYKLTLEIKYNKSMGETIRIDTWG